jgi:hypothetical protein
MLTRGPNLSLLMASNREVRDALDSSERVVSELASEIGARPGIIQEEVVIILQGLPNVAIQENDR